MGRNYPESVFASALANANADSIVGIFKMIGWLMIYARIATFGVTRLFLPAGVFG